jgi:hypothetical protein
MIAGIGQSGFLVALVPTNFVAPFVTAADVSSPPA